VKAVAVFAAKGGVGKTTIAVHLAHAAATLGGRRTLLWDLDPQGAATWLLAARPQSGLKARRALAGDAPLAALVRETDVPNLAVLPADRSLRRAEGDLARDDRQRRLRRLLRGVADGYDRVIIDLPPGLSELSDRVLRAVDLVVVPTLPSPLSGRADEQLAEELRRHHRSPPPLLPVWTMVDRRRALHRAAVEAAPDRPLIPYSASVEGMAVRRAPVLATAPASPAARAFVELFTAVERALLAADAA